MPVFRLASTGLDHTHTLITCAPSKATNAWSRPVEAGRKRRHSFQNFAPGRTNLLWASRRRSFETTDHDRCWTWRGLGSGTGCRVSEWRHAGEASPSYTSDYYSSHCPSLRLRSASLATLLGLQHQRAALVCSYESRNGWAMACVA